MASGTLTTTTDTTTDTLAITVRSPSSRSSLLLCILDSFVHCLICIVTLHVLVHCSQHIHSRTSLGWPFLEPTYVVEFSCRC